MTPDSDLERRVADWLEEGPLEPAGWAVEDAIRHAASTPRRRRYSLGSRAMTRFLVAAAVAAAVILGVAVARFAPSSSVGGPPTASPAPSAAGLTGSWTAQVGPNSAGALEGSWTVTFTDLQVFYRNPGGVSFSQGATYNGDQVTLDPDDCPSGTGTGTWRWVVSGDTLSLTVVSDPSACRSAVLGASPFQRATQP